MTLLIPVNFVFRTRAVLGQTGGRRRAGSSPILVAFPDQHCIWGQQHLTDARDKLLQTRLWKVLVKRQGTVTGSRAEFRLSLLLL